MRSISIGRVIVHWLLATMESLLEAEESMELLKSYRDGSKAFFFCPEVREQLQRLCNHLGIRRWWPKAVLWFFWKEVDEGMGWVCL